MPIPSVASAQVAILFGRAGLVFAYGMTTGGFSLIEADGPNAQVEDQRGRTPRSEEHLWGVSARGVSRRQRVW